MSSKIRKLCSVILLIVFTNPSAWAFGWSEEVLDWADKFKVRFNNPYVYTVHGSCKAPTTPMDVLDDIFNTKTMKSSHVEKGKLQIYEGLQYEILSKDGPFNPIPASVVAFFPGAFNNLGEKMGRRFMDAFHKAGHHTLAFPDTWGTQFIKAKPFHRLGHVTNEMKSIYELFRNEILELKQKNLINGPVSIFGISHGAFMAASVAAYDSEQEVPLIDGEVTLVSPPIILSETLTQLTEQKKQVRSFYEDWNWLSLALEFMRFCSIGNDNSLDDMDFLMAKTLSIYGGFHWTLAKSARTYDKVWDLDEIPNRSLFTYRAYRAWKRSITFRKYLENYAQESLDEIMGPTGDIFYWIEKAKSNGFNNFRVLLSEDDFLNFSGRSSDFYNHLDPKQIIVLSNGGHYGFRSDHWFMQFLALAYKRARKTNGQQ